MNSYIKLLLANTLSTYSKSLSRRSRGRRFIDWKRIKVIAGHGGHGCTSFRRERYLPWGGPNGGDGGDGGNVVFVATQSVFSMGLLRHRYKAENGGNGEGMKRKGRNGNDTVVKVPLGTIVKEDGKVIADLSSEGTSFTVAHGGEGGRGNVSFASPELQSPRESTEGSQGQERMLEVELQTIADIGMVGFPNAGKSTLLRCISRARPAVASYPFTTLNPHIGVLEGPADVRLSVADIPGILPGAHQNYGLGHSFLRHIERCHSLLYVLDPSSDALPEKTIPDALLSSRAGLTNLYQQLLLLQNELRLYDQRLLDKQQLIVVNKMDIDGAEECARQLKKNTELMIIPVSGLHRFNIEALTNILYKIYTNNRKKSLFV